jgi:hypothetical protein
VGAPMLAASWMALSHAESETLIDQAGGVKARDGVCVNSAVRGYAMTKTAKTHSLFGSGGSGLLLALDVLLSAHSGLSGAARQGAAVERHALDALAQERSFL